MKPCSKCKEEKDLLEFSKDRSRKDELTPWCKECLRGYYLDNRVKKIEYVKRYQQSHKIETAGYKRKYRQSHKVEKAEQQRSPVGREVRKRAGKKHREKYPERAKAHNAVNNAIRDGKLIRPTICPSCDTETFIEAHHESYEEIHWLDVEWLCIKCHRSLHRGVIKKL